MKKGPFKNYDQKNVVFDRLKFISYANRLPK